MKTLIVYYSYLGNTKSIAEMIQKKTGADILRIETVVPYDNDYNKVVDQGQSEVNRGYCPEIKPLNIDPGQYDTIILGTPVWWYTFASIGVNGCNPMKKYKSIMTKSGMNIKFDEATLRTSVKDIENWIDKIS